MQRSVPSSVKGLMDMMNGHLIACSLNMQLCSVYIYRSYVHVVIISTVVIYVQLLYDYKQLYTCSFMVYESFKTPSLLVKTLLLTTIYPDIKLFEKVQGAHGHILCNYIQKLQGGVRMQRSVPSSVQGLIDMMNGQLIAYSLNTNITPALQTQPLAQYIYIYVYIYVYRYVHIFLYMYTY